MKWDLNLRPADEISNFGKDLLEWHTDDEKNDENLSLEWVSISLDQSLQ